MPLWLNQSLGFDTDVSGYMSTTFDVGCAIGGPLMGHAADWVQSKRNATTTSSSELIVIWTKFRFCNRLVPRINLSKLSKSQVVAVGSSIVTMGLVGLSMTGLVSWFNAGLICLCLFAVGVCDHGSDILLAGSNAI